MPAPSSTRTTRGMPWPGIELIVADRALTGVFPTHHGEACIWICSPSADAHAARRGAASREQAFTTYLSRTAPELAGRLRAAPRTSAVTGMLRTPNYLRRAQGRAGRWSVTPATTATRSPATASATPTGTPNCSRSHSTTHCAGETDEGIALAGYQHQRDEALRDIFDLTCALASYPPVPEFVELQKRLSAAIDLEAAEVAARPVPGDREYAAA